MCSHVFSLCVACVSVCVDGYDPSQGLSGGPLPQSHSGDPWRINKFGLRNWLMLGFCNTQTDHQKQTENKRQTATTKAKRIPRLQKIAFPYDM